MRIDRELWKSHFDIKKLHNWICPTCKKGKLTATENDFIIEETTTSKENHTYEDFDSNCVKSSFNGILLVSIPSVKKKYLLLEMFHMKRL